MISVPRISTSVSQTSGVSLVSLASLQSHHKLTVGQLIWKRPPIRFNMDGAASRVSCALICREEYTSGE